MSYLQNFNLQILGEDKSPKLVFLHGMMGYGQNWRMFAKHFSARFQVLYYDQRGHGHSFKPESGYEPENYAEDLRLILDELGWKKIFLVGHSMGARNAHHFAFKYPEKVIALVIEDIGPDPNMAAIQRNENILSQVPVPSEHKEPVKEAIFKSFDSTMANFLYSNIEKKSDGSFDWRFSKPAILETVRAARLVDYWDEIEGLKVPTLLIHGTESDELSENVYLRMLEVNPRIQGIQIGPAGHWVHYDQPQKFQEALEKFFAPFLSK